MTAVAAAMITTITSKPGRSARERMMTTTTAMAVVTKTPSPLPPVFRLRPICTKIWCTTRKNTTPKRMITLPSPFAVSRRGIRCDPTTIARFQQSPLIVTVESIQEEKERLPFVLPFDDPSTAVVSDLHHKQPVRLSELSQELLPLLPLSSPITRAPAVATTTIAVAAEVLCGIHNTHHGLLKRSALAATGGRQLQRPLQQQ